MHYPFCRSIIENDNIVAFCLKKRDILLLVSKNYIFNLILH